MPVIQLDGAMLQLMLPSPLPTQGVAPHTDACSAAEVDASPGNPVEQRIEELCRRDALAAPDLPMPSSAHVLPIGQVESRNACVRRRVFSTNPAVRALPVEPADRVELEVLDGAEQRDG